MTRKIFVLIIAATAAAASCTKTDTVIQEETGAAGSEMEFAATVSDCMPSKATSGNTWDPGDETITVQVLDRYDPSASLSWDGAATGYYRAGTSALEFVSGEKSYWNGKDEEKMVRAWYLGTGEKRDRLPSADSRVKAYISTTIRGATTKKAIQPT